MKLSISTSKGFSLIEVLIALVILSISLLGLATLTVTATRSNSFGSHVTEATTFAQDRLEELRVTPWDNILTGNDTVMVRATSGITFTRNWNVVANAEDTLKTVTITTSWNDGVNRSVGLTSAISR